MDRVLLLTILGLLGAGCAPFKSSTLNSQPPSGSLEIEAPPSPPAPRPPPISETIEKARWESTNPEARQWTQFAYQQLEVDGLDLLSKAPTDVQNFCPNYQNLNRSQRKNFWVYLLSSIAFFESAFDPATKYTESFTDSSGVRVVSRGLLQLSIESARGYDCVLQRAEDLHDPLANLACGIRILNRWVGRDGVIRADVDGWKGGARYWSVLRRDAQFNSIRGWTASQAYCNLGSS